MLLTAMAPTMVFLLPCAELKKKKRKNGKEKKFHSNKLRERRNQSHYGKKGNFMKYIYRKRRREKEEKSTVPTPLGK